MLKKILSIALGVSLMTSSAYASVSVTPYDVENDIIQISSEGNAGEKLTVLITNPGFDTEDAASGVEGAIQYYDTYIPADKNFTFPVQITGASGGEFNIYIKSKNVNETGSFVFYNSLFKKQCIDDINAAGENEDITVYYENLIKSYAMESNEIYSSLGSQKCAAAFLNLRNSLPEKKLPDGIGEVMSLIEKSFVLAAFSDGSEELCFDDDKLLYADILTIADTDELIDYYENIDTDALDDFNDKLIGADYKSLEEIKERFCELVYINVLTNYIKSGYGHVHGYFEKYAEAYENAGFEIPSKENKSIYTKLTNLEADTLSELAKKFNKLDDGDSGGGSSGGGSRGNSGGNYSVIGSQGFVNPETVDTPAQGETDSETEENPGKADFTDVPAFHWAYDAISFLSNEGFVNGYSDGSFCPDNMITRAEFTKIIAEVFKLDSSDGQDFSDVLPDAWYAPYVAAASAKGIITGDGLNFYPERNITREDAAVILWRLLGSSTDGEPVFSDSDKISAYAADAVAALSGAGIINGYEDNSFRPQNSITRAEASKMIHKMLEKGGSGV